MKYCIHCGKEINETAAFCPYCGKKQAKTAEGKNNKKQDKLTAGTDVRKGTAEQTISLTKENGQNLTIKEPAEFETKAKKHRKRLKRIILGVIGVCMCIVIMLTIKRMYTVYSNKPENKFKKVANEFVECINAGDYEDAKAKLFFPYTVGGSFENFAKENLKGCKLKKTEEGYTLISDQGSYKLSCNESGDVLTSEDFVMEYYVKYSSYMSSSNNTFVGSSEVLDNGMSLYTVKVYKTHEIEFNCDIILGEPENTVPQITIKLETDKDYKVCNITQASHYADSNESYDGAYLEEDGTIVIDLYYISETYSKGIAKTFSGYLTDMVNATFSGESSDDFISGYHNYIFGTDAQQEEYENWYSKRDTYLQYTDKVDFTSKEWEYPKEFRYSDDEYIINDTITLEAYENGAVKDTSTASYYVLFKPGKERLKVYSYSSTKENLY